jgi:hypothetical protein
VKENTVIIIVGNWGVRRTRKVDRGGGTRKVPQKLRLVGVRGARKVAIGDGTWYKIGERYAVPERLTEDEVRRTREVEKHWSKPQVFVFICQDNSVLRLELLAQGGC